MYMYIYYIIIYYIILYIGALIIKSGLGERAYYNYAGTIEVRSIRPYKMVLRVPAHTELWRLRFCRLFWSRWLTTQKLQKNDASLKILGWGLTSNM